MKTKKLTRAQKEAQGTTKPAQSATNGYQAKQFVRVEKSQ